jgi:1-acyl-sn-glycerol-3-phosphate acyltransferase
MARRTRDPLTWLFLLWVVACTAAFEVLLPWHLLWGWLIRRQPLDRVLREHIWLYGRYLIYGVARPLLKVRVGGCAGIPQGRPVVYVLNHRSAADAYFSACYAGPQTLFLVRSWPFRIPVYGWFMRRAGYIDMESLSFSQFAEGPGRRAVERGCSLIVFPEGHRSPDGRMQRFHSGAFEFAARHGLLVVPVCLKGTERFLPVENPSVHPARVEIQVLEPVDPAAYPGHEGVLAMRRQVQARMRQALGEPARAAGEGSHASARA